MIRGDPAGALADMKRLDGRDIVLFGTDLALRLTGARVFDGGAVVLRYATTWIQVPAAYEASGGHPS